MALQFIHVPVVIKSTNFIHLTENWPIQDSHKCTWIQF